jgi:hypothetical protein
MTSATASDEPQLARVWKFAQERIVARWSEVLDYPAEDRIQERARMHDVQVERHELAAQVQLGSIIQWVAVIIFQSLLDRPSDDVAQRVEIEVQIERDAIIKPDAFIIDRIVTDQAKTKCDNFTLLSPDKETRPFRHSLSDRTKIIFR